MTESKKKEKKTCQFELGDYKCDKPLYDKNHCIFHSKDTENKEESFISAFWQEYEFQKKNEILEFIGFIFPKGIDLKKTALGGTDLRGANLRDANLQGASLRGSSLWSANLQGAKLVEADLRGVTINKTNLQGADLKKADLQKTKIFSSNLQGATLINADLREATLVGADLRKAKLMGAKLHKANLWENNLQGAMLTEANFQATSLYGTNFTDASLIKVNLRDAKFLHSNLTNADLQEANLIGTCLLGSSFIGANVIDVKYDRSTKFRGINVTQALGSPAFIRFAKDQEFLEEMQSTKWGKFKYQVWNVFADCGRSMGRWLLWCLVIALFFGAVFADYPVPNIKPQFLQDFLTSINPEFHIEPTSRIPTFFTPYYFSIVTFTTLGFGDVTPLNLAGEIWLALEVFLGYIMLGGLISIFANKLARRS